MSRNLTTGLFGAKELNIGDRVTCGVITVTTDMIDRFAELTGDRFEIHMTDEAARRHGFDRRVAHGLLVLSLIDGLKNKASAQIKARASMGWDWRFRAPVLAGDDLHAAYTIRDKQPARSEGQTLLTLDFEVSNQDGVAVQAGTNRLLAYDV